jgi:glycosyltransferase involved in cell wall biosynthesis
MRVQIVDPGAYTPPYDHGLAAGLARAGAEVELLTSRYLYGPLPAVDGFRRSETFFRRTSRPGLPPGARRPLKALEHVPDMLSFRRRAREADVRHYQWLPIEALDAVLLPPARPNAFTVHNVRRRGEGRLVTALTRSLVSRMDALVVHTRDAAALLVERFGAAPERIHRIPHGALDYLTRLPEERPLPPELAAVEAPVILWFGNVRRYKGVDVLLDAFAEIQGAELWVVGKPEMPMSPLHELARRASGTVRFVERFVPDPEIPAYFRRADLVALPHRTIDQSGVLYAALAFAKPMVIAAVGGFREVGEEHGAARLVPPEDPAALAGALRELLADAPARALLSAGAAAAAAGPYSWDEIGRRTLALYKGLVG